jgi:Flp pilus assembly protein TadD
MRRGDFVYAERMFRRVALLVPEKSDGAVGLTRALLALKDTNPAALWADYAVAIDPGNASPHLVRGDVYAAEGQLDQARREWQDAARLDPGNPEAQTRLHG